MPGASDDGYATPAAALISVAISLIAVAVVARSLAELKLARSELARIQVEYHLDGAHNAAMLAISTSSRPPPYQWTFAGLGSAMNVIAEPEYLKLSPTAFSGLEDDVFLGLGVAAPSDVKARLMALRLGPKLTWMADLDSAPDWRTCAPALVSLYGRATTPANWNYSTPESGKQPNFWRAGEVWRIQITTKDGWRDERVVRFTGNGLTPAAVIGRRLSRNLKGERKCENVF